MPPQAQNRRELPPTAGLPLNFSDYARRPALPLAAGLERWPGLPGAIPTCSGTTALVVALKTLRRRAPERDTIIVPAYTCPLVPLATRLLPGLRVLLCDTLPGGFDFDPQKLASLCDVRTLAVIPTHLGGRVADVAAVKPGLGSSARQGALNRIAAKHFDFVVCRSGDLSVVCAVELNDRSHSSQRAQARDELLANVCRAINLPLLTVPAKAAYSSQDVRAQFLAAVEPSPAGVRVGT